MKPNSSWKIIASAVSGNRSGRITSPAIAAFLTDPWVLALVKSPSQVFGPSTPETRSDFETRTSAIHVTPAPNDRYDIKQIKEDATWLSKNVGINEVAALRVAVVELQARPQSYLRQPLSKQDIASVQEADGGGNGQLANLLASVNASPPVAAEELWKSFESENGRRHRLLATYFSERRFFIMTADHLLTFMMHSQRAFQDQDAEQLREEVLKAAFGPDSHVFVSAVESLLPTYLAMVAGLLAHVRDGPSAVLKCEITAALELEWYSTCLSEATHAMSLIYMVLDLTGSLFASKQVVSQWFELMDEFDFLDELSGVRHYDVHGKRPRLIHVNFRTRLCHYKRVRVSSPSGS
jgi:nuclear pore complex protein Nup188